MRKTWIGCLFVLTLAALACSGGQPATPTATWAPSPTAPPEPPAPATQTPIPDGGTPLSGAVTGSVLIEEGRSAAGGIAGETINVSVAFDASSTAADVTEMRVLHGSCRTEAEMADAPWQPYATEVSYPFMLPINWVGFYVSVQYRDALGNLSPVYCDDISLEGMPAPPSP